jgi:SAM-dependent methyltransferase
MSLFDLVDAIPIAWIILIFALGVIVSISWTDVVGAPYIPTPRRTVRVMLALAGLGPDDLLYDLGSGDGRVLFIAAEEFGAKAVGIEIDPLRYLWVRMLIRLRGLTGKVEILFGNFFDVNLNQADVVTCYLRSSTNNRLEGKFESELRPGTRVASRKFKFLGWPLIDEDRDEQVYLYRMGGRSELALEQDGISR